MLIKDSQNDAAKLAADFLKAGKIISFATDTIYGLACDAGNTKAVENLYEIKKRSKKKPIAILVKNLEVAKKIFYFDFLVEKIAKKFLPGPLTMVLRIRQDKDCALAKNLNNEEDFLGFRIIKTDFIEKLFSNFDGILALSSANISDEENIFLPEKITEIFHHENILIIDSGPIEKALPSTVIKICDQKIEIIREGAIKKEVLQHENF